MFELQSEQIAFSFEESGDRDVLVSLENFHGIEIEDFACCVARTALWIAEKQADMDTAKVTQRVYQELPLRDYGGIVNANSLRIDWNDVVPADEVNFVIGNPPFLGARLQSAEQKQDVLAIFDNSRNAGNIDYCGAWHMKAARYTEGTHARCAFVSTNSICQGEQVANIWKPLCDTGVHIDFAHNTFRWDNEAVDKANVFCVIVGFSREKCEKKLFYHATPDSGEKQIAMRRINAYLKDAPDVFIYPRKKPICQVPEMGIGNKPIDGGFYLFTEEEKQEFVRKEPGAEPYFHRWVGAKEFINGIRRWCLWLGDASFAELKELPCCRERVQAVRDYRLSSSSAPTRNLAEKPTRFHVENMPKNTSVLVPQTSSQRRKYIPMGFLAPGVLCSNAVRIIPDGSLYEYGVLQSKFHNAWMRCVTGRMKDDYQYATSVVYNCFVWPEPTDEQRRKVEQCAQSVLDARDMQEGATLADMYDPENEAFFPELLAAHKALDAAVEAAYGVDFGGDEEKIVAHLFKLYAEKTAGE